jgi:TonB family protein
MNQNKMKNSIKYFLFTFIIISPILFAQSGSVKSYYPDHKVKSDILYVNDIMDGPAVWYYPNGKVIMEKSYSRGILEGWVREYYDNGQLKCEYNVKSGIKDGDEKKYFENGNLSEILSYADGKLLNKQTFASVDEPVTNKKEGIEIANQTGVGLSNKENLVKRNAGLEVKKEIQEDHSKVEDVVTQPVIIGGINSIKEKIVYPADALKFGLEGTVTIRAIIDDKGNPVKTEIVKSLGLGCDSEASRVVMESKFFAAAKNGRLFESQILIDVPFVLPIKKTEIAKDESKPVEATKQGRKYEENLSVMCEADRCPRPEDDIATIYSLFQIPNVAKALKLRGMILIEGIVDKFGKFSQTKIIDGVGYGCDQLVETALQKTKFTLGIKKGEPVETKALVNFPFSYDR